MFEQKVKIDHLFDYSDGTILEIHFYGSTNIALKQEFLEKIVIDTFQNRTKSPNIIEIVNLLKYLLQEIQENILDICLFKENKYKKKAYYFQGRLNNYCSYCKLEQDNEQIDLKFEYYRRNDSKFSFNNSHENRFNYSILQNIQEEYTNDLFELYQLQNIKPLPLDKEDKMICTIYRLFYQENPNFSLFENRIKAQTMFAFLNECKLWNKKNYDFHLCPKTKTVISPALTIGLNKLSIFGEISPEIGSIKLSDDEEQTIQIIGQELRKYMDRQENPTTWFTNFVKTLHLKNDCFKTKDHEYPEYTLINSLKLVRKIKQKINV